MIFFVRMIVGVVGVFFALVAGDELGDPVVVVGSIVVLVVERVGFERGELGERFSDGGQAPESLDGGVEFFDGCAFGVGVVPEPGEDDGVGLGSGFGEGS